MPIKSSKYIHAFPKPCDTYIYMAYRTEQEKKRTIATHEENKKNVIFRSSLTMAC